MMSTKPGFLPRGIGNTDSSGSVRHWLPGRDTMVLHLKPGGDQGPLTRGGSWKAALNGMGIATEEER